MERTPFVLAFDELDLVAVDGGHPPAGLLAVSRVGFARRGNALRSQGAWKPKVREVGFLCSPGPSPVTAGGGVSACSEWALPLRDLFEGYLPSDGKVRK